ncbi:MAG: hypothetical protein M3371_03640 [Acidobacteriota bacterium]|nr:hypothetical protein [Acidobacteriota bacterium]
MRRVAAILLAAGRSRRMGALPSSIARINQPVNLTAGVGFSSNCQADKHI